MRREIIRSLPWDWSYFQAPTGIYGPEGLRIFGDGARFSTATRSGSPETHAVLTFPNIPDASPSWSFLWGCRGAENECFGPSLISWRDERGGPLWLDAYTATVRGVPQERRGCIGLATARDYMGEWQRRPEWVPRLGHAITATGVFSVGLIASPDTHTLWLFAWDVSAMRFDAYGKLDDGAPTLLRYVVDTGPQYRDCGVGVPRYAGRIMGQALDRFTFWGDVALGADGHLYAVGSTHWQSGTRSRIVEWRSLANVITDWRNCEHDDLRFELSGRVFTAASGGPCWDGGYFRDEKGKLVTPGAVILQTGAPDFATRGATWLEIVADDDFVFPLSWGKQPIEGHEVDDG